MIGNTEATDILLAKALRMHTIRVAIEEPHPPPATPPPTSSPRPSSWLLRRSSLGRLG